MSRAAYHAEYYQRTAPRRRQLARARRQLLRWIPWLLANLKWPAEPAIVVPSSYPIRRPLLKLPVRP